MEYKLITYLLKRNNFSQCTTFHSLLTISRLEATTSSPLPEILRTPWHSSKDRTRLSYTTSLCIPTLVWNKNSVKTTRLLTRLLSCSQLKMTNKSSQKWLRICLADIKLNLKNVPPPQQWVNMWEACKHIAAKGRLTSLWTVSRCAKALCSCKKQRPRLPKSQMRRSNHQPNLNLVQVLTLTSSCSVKILAMKSSTTCWIGWTRTFSGSFWRSQLPRTTLCNSSSISLAARTRRHQTLCHSWPQSSRIVNQC